jgi:amino acid adenylation domain-containing protein
VLLAPFLQQCRQQPEALALLENDRSLSYGQLLQSAQAVATELQTMGIQPGQPVAIHLDRGIAATIATFGVLLAGACYVPLDLKNPIPRLSYIIEDAQVVAVIGWADAPTWLNNKLWLDINSCPDAQPLSVNAQASSLAAILYTSGSTGHPRGVALSHSAITTFALWAAELVDLQTTDRIASTTPLFFDLSTFDLYAVLGRGASLHFVPAMLTIAPARLSAWLAEQAISGWYTVPSLLAFLAYKGNLAQTSLSSLRFLLFAGEVFPTPALLDLTASLPHTSLYNLFGPTETNVCCYWPVSQTMLAADQSIPIGRPAAACELCIHDKTGDGTGELWVRGPSLASGYWSKGQLHPIINPHGWYATGDRVSLVDGEYWFHGRLGRMLKCSGYRVEPAEIEAVVNAMPGVRGCAVVGTDDPATGQRPALALTLDTQVTAENIRKALALQLPSYMQPKRCIVVPELPRLSNGKLDYQRVSALLEGHL